MSRFRVPDGMDKLLKSLKSKDNRVLVIGDLHEPFCLDGYMEFCEEQRDKFNCNRVVFIGDIIDNHYSSYHETDPNGYGGGRELELAVEKIQRWNKVFPVAEVIIGNHDRLIMRKAQSSAIPSQWIKEYKDVLNTPKWDFKEQTIIDGVLYIHGEGGTARSRIKKDLQSTVQGHLHLQAYNEWLVGRNYKIFGMQVGCGVDDKTYAMAYARNYGKSAIGCGVILDNGNLPINILMKL